MDNWFSYFDFPPKADIVLALIIWVSAVYFFLRLSVSLYRLAAIATGLALLSVFLYRLWSQAGHLSLDSLVSMVLATYFGQIFEYYIIAFLLLAVITSVFGRNKQKGIFKGR
jgi:hypothetical protein